MFKDYFEDKADQVIDKMEKTPMQKLIIALLAIVSVSVVVLGILQIKNQLEQPFLAQKLIEDKAEIRGPRDFLEFFEREQRNQEQVTRLQGVDSDNDTLSDYQEIYIYRTNAYNDDSDLDGIKDNQEIDQGTDPNCPEGELCDSEGFVIRETVQPAVVQQINIPELINQSENSFNELLEYSTDEREQIKTYFSQLSTQELKELLQAQGFPQEQLNLLSDQDLQSMLDSLLSSI